MEFVVERILPVDGTPVPGEVLLVNPTMDFVVVASGHADDDPDLVESEEILKTFQEPDFFGAVRAPGCHVEYEGPVLAGIVVQRLLLAVECVQLNVSTDFLGEGIEPLHPEDIVTGTNDEGKNE